MAYVKTDWVAGATPLSEVNMDHLETQYDEAKSEYDEYEKLKRIFALAVPGADPAVAGLGGVKVDGGTDIAYMRMIVPPDFTALTSIEVIFLPSETGASMNFVVSTYFGAYNGGEDYNVHTETADPRDIGATVTDQYLAHDISDLVNIAPLTIGDLLIVSVGYDAAGIDSNANVVGLRFIYS